MIAIYQKNYNFFPYNMFFLFPILISIIFAKNFAFKRVIHNVLLKLDVKNLFCKYLHFSYIRIAESNQNNQFQASFVFAKLSYSFQGMESFINLVIDAKSEKQLKNVASQRFCIQKTYIAAYMIQLTFVYISYSSHIFCIYKKHTKAVSVRQLYSFVQFAHYLQLASQSYVQRNIQRSFQLARCIGFVQFVHCLYVQKTYISSFKSELCSSQVLYSLHIFCIAIWYTQLASE